MQITNNKSLEDYLITPAETSVIFKDNMNQPIHRWFLYTQGFSNEFVDFYFDKYGIDSSKSVYEPFMGSGTVGLCSKFNNVHSFGVELNPFMHFISSIKTNFDKYSIKTTKKLVEELKFPKKPNILPPSFLLNDKHFLPEILIEILKIKQAIFSLPEVPEKDLMKLAFSNILLKSSNAQRFPSFGYKKKKNLTPELPYDLFYSSIENIINDIEIMSNEDLATVDIIKGDSREQHFPDNSADIAITSPPYANGMDYVTDYQLEMAWLGLIDKEDRTMLRDGMIAYDKTRNGILKDFFNKGEYYQEENLMKIINELESVSKNYWKKDIHLVLLKYFDDMYKVLKNTYDILKSEGRFILVLGDSLFNNVYVPADLLIGIMGEKIGYEFESIKIARTRYSGQNRSYKLRETIVTLKK